MGSPLVLPQPKKLPTRPALLILEPNHARFEQLCSDPKVQLSQPLLVQQGREAMSHIMNTGLSLAAIVLSPKAMDPDYLTLMRTARAHRADVPVFIIDDFTATDLNRGSVLTFPGVQGMLEKDFDYSALAKKHLAPAQLIDVNDVLTRSKKTSTAIGQEVQDEDHLFIALPVDDFIENFKNYFDLYVRLASGKYVKILNAGDTFTSDRLEKYRGKGLTHLYLRKTDERDYLALSDRMVARLNTLPTVDPKIKLVQTYHHGNQVARALEPYDHFTQEDLQFVLSYVDRLLALMSELQLQKQSKLIENILDDSKQVEHAVSVAALAALLARQSGFETQKSLRMIGISSFLHDIGIPNNMKGLEDLDENEMNAEQKKVYFNHPTRGARILRDVRGLDPVVIQTVLLHHRRKDGSGFPNGSGIGLSNISLPVEIVGLADVLVRFTQREQSRGLSEQDRKLRLEVSALQGFSGELVTLASKTFRLGGSSKK